MMMTMMWLLLLCSEARVFDHFITWILLDSALPRGRDKRWNKQMVGPDVRAFSKILFIFLLLSPSFLAFLWVLAPLSFSSLSLSPSFLGFCQSRGSSSLPTSSSFSADLFKHILRVKNVSFPEKLYCTIVDFIWEGELGIKFLHGARIAHWPLQKRQKLKPTHSCFMNLFPWGEIVERQTTSTTVLLCPPKKWY